ncbi:hypothetical protein [Streptomyces tubercidicus]
MLQVLVHRPGELRLRSQLTPRWVKDRGRRADGLLAELTEIDHVEFDF